ncbi:MAG: transposase domain-containing protein, partial [Oscillibacter sp.]|nr:transposase domain-containing protein [Oscillibacter sp.]
ELKKKKVEEDAARFGIDPEQYLTKLLERSLDDEEKAGDAHKSSRVDTDRGICLVRYYPVLKGETETEALKRAKAEETKGRRREWVST